VRRAGAGADRLEVRPARGSASTSARTWSSAAGAYSSAPATTPKRLTGLEDQHYSTFAVQSLPPEGAALTVYTVDEDEAPTGRWLFQLVPKD
jgi:hypothetical protein